MDEPDLSQPQRGQFGLAAGVDLVAEHRERAGVDPLQARDQVEQGALAGSAGPGQRGQRADGQCQ
ncbi:hypothetical protein U5072_07860 [Streptomyces sp. SS162]